MLSAFLLAADCDSERQVQVPLSGVDGSSSIGQACPAEGFRELLVSEL